ncbi:MAG: MerR family transcriptional regulator [Polaromonas sp.]|nr:MerR family transcriptional regulator [Polaromonas sp.]
MEKPLSSIPAKRYFTIGEVSDLCGVKPHVLRYWEQEFTQLRPMKRRGNRRYYQHHEVLMIRRIRDLLYDQGFTITGARNKLQETFQSERDARRSGDAIPGSMDTALSDDVGHGDFDNSLDFEDDDVNVADISAEGELSHRLQLIRRELYEIRNLLSETD